MDNADFGACISCERKWKTFMGEFKRYWGSERVAPDGNLRLILQGNYFSAFQNADDWRKTNMSRLVEYINKNAPSDDCHGSSTKVENWLSRS